LPLSLNSTSRHFRFVYLFCQLCSIIIRKQLFVSDIFFCIPCTGKQLLPIENSKQGGIEPVSWRNSIWKWRCRRNCRYRHLKLLAFNWLLGCGSKFWKYKHTICKQKKGRKRKLREDEIVCPTSKAVYKWRAERKR